MKEILKITLMLGLVMLFIANTQAQQTGSIDNLDLARIKSGKTGRISSWNQSGANRDAISIKPGKTVVLADIKGPGVITHIWMTQKKHYRECLLKITWDDADYPSVLVPLGDFFCLGNSIVNSFQSMLFTASTRDEWANQFNEGCGLNCYVPMPFQKRAVIELVNESSEGHFQYFYIDYESYDKPLDDDLGYFHSEFRRCNRFLGWGEDLTHQQVNSYQNKEKEAWSNNYVILETKGKGQFIGCNISVTNLDGGWWGEGDDMIWVDGYKWPPDLHGTGSEDYLNQAWGMQPNAFLRNGSSIWEGNTSPQSRYTTTASTTKKIGGYQTSYVFHIENPVRFNTEIKVTMEHGHANRKNNEMSSVAYWYSDKPTPIAEPPSVEKRMPILRDNEGNWIFKPDNECPCKLNSAFDKIEKYKSELKVKN